MIVRKKVEVLLPFFLLKKFKKENFDVVCTDIFIITETFIITKARL